MQELLDAYWLVSRCWNNHALAIEHNMTVEKAIKTLRRVIEKAKKIKGGGPLVRESRRLIQDIVNRQDESQEMNG